MKLILTDIKKIIDFKLTKTNENYYNDVLYSILDIIYSMQINNNNFIKISLPTFKSVLNIPTKQVKRHINFLIENNIINRSKLLFNGDTNRYETYKYKINKKVIDEINSFNFFIYEVQDNYINEIDIAKNIRLTDNKILNLEHALNNTTIDVPTALETIYNSDKSKISKINIALNVYKLYFGIHKLRYGNNVNRVYSAVTSISSIVHENIYINKKRVSEVDANSSMLTLISNKTRHVQSKLHQVIDNEDIYTWIMNRIKYKLSIEEKTYPLEHEIENELTYTNKLYKLNDEKLYRRKNGVFRFYENEKWYYIKHQDITRDLIKKQVYASIFSGFNKTSMVSEIIHESFGNAINEIFKEANINIHDKDKGSKLAIYIYNIESNIWINTASELITLGINVITKHDSILFLKKDTQIVKETLHKHMTSNGIKNYKLTFKLREMDELPITPKIIINYKIRRYSSSNGNIKTVKYNFYNKKTTERYTGTQNNFINIFKLNKGNVSKLINGTRKSTGGWIIIENEYEKTKNMKKQEQKQKYDIILFYDDDEIHTSDTYVDRIIVNEDMKPILPLENKMERDWVTFSEYKKHVKHNKKDNVEWKKRHKNQLRIYKHADELLKNYSYEKYNK